MRIGVHSGEAYPLYNCTNDTVEAIEKIDDPAAQRLALYLRLKKTRPRFDRWLPVQRKREDPVGALARWYVENVVKKHRSWRLGSPPETSLNVLKNAFYALGIAGDEKDALEEGAAMAIEEWDRWDMDDTLRTALLHRGGAS